MQLMTKISLTLLSSFIIFIGNCKAQNSGDLYIVNVEIDTVFSRLNDNRCCSYCQRRNYRSLQSQEYLKVAKKKKHFNIGDNPTPNIPTKNATNENSTTLKEDTIMLKGKVSYLFFWKDDYVFVCAYDTVVDGLTGKHKTVNLDSVIKEPRRLKYKPFVSNSIQRKFKASFIDKETGIRPMTYQWSQNPEAGSVNIIGVDFSEKCQDPNEEPLTGLYIMSDSIEQEGSINFLISHSYFSNALFIKPLKYWLFLKSELAYRFKQRTISDTLSLKVAGSKLNSQYVRRCFQLVAFGLGNDKDILLKNHLFIDRNVYGEFECMLPGTCIPTIDPFHDKLNMEKSVSIDRNTIFRIKAFSCKNLLAINPKLETVNSLHYLPMVYFLPSYFDVKTINGLSKEDFIKEQCKN
jgi:hypothetical protein